MFSAYILGLTRVVIRLQATFFPQNTLGVFFVICFKSATPTFDGQLEETPHFDQEKKSNQ